MPTIEKLTVNEEILRDLYLRRLALGELQGPPTNIVADDKIWLKYYSEDDIRNRQAEAKTIYRAVYDNNVAHFNEYFLEYFDKKITYKEFFDQVDKYATGFSASGIKEGDIVTLATATTPDDMMMYFALNKIGAICHSVDLRYKRNAFKAVLNRTGSKFIAISDVCYDEICAIIDETNVQEVFINDTSDYMNPFFKIAYRAKFGKKIKYSGKFKPCRELIERSYGQIPAKEVPYSDSRITNLINTSGTSGKSKIVELTDENINSIINGYKNTGLNFERGLRYVNVMPNFLIFGRVVGLIMPAYFGIYTILDPDINPEKFPMLLHKHKPNILLLGPIHYQSLVNHESVLSGDQYDIKIFASGGSKLDPNLKLQAMKLFERHGVKKPIILEGCGTTEDSGTECTCIDELTFAPGSVGIPLVHNDMGIFKPGTEEKLSYGEYGEICYSGPSQAKGYYKDDEKTKEAFKKHSDGKVWFHTNDIAYVDEDGKIYIKDRIKRVITSQGFGVYPSEVEEVIKEHYAVEDCIVAPMPISDSEVTPKAHIKLKKKYQSYEGLMKDEINDLCLHTLADYSIPRFYEFTEELPYTPAGKPDYRKLEESNLQKYESVQSKKQK